MGSTFLVNSVYSGVCTIFYFCKSVWWPKKLDLFSRLFFSLVRGWSLELRPDQGREAKFRLDQGMEFGAETRPREGD